MLTIHEMIKIRQAELGPQQVVELLVHLMYRINLHIGNKLVIDKL